MRKLLILMLVLGMASAANAAFTLMVAQGGDGTVKGVVPDQGDYYDPLDTDLYLAPTEYLWVGVYNDTDGVAGDLQKGQFWMAMVTDPEASWTGNWVQYKPPLVADATDNQYYGTTDAGTGDGLIDLWNLSLTDASVNPNLIGVLDAKELHCDEPSYPDHSVEIILWDIGFNEIDRIQIHQIPEPMTMLLLGLGGLFLRRRK